MPFYFSNLILQFALLKNGAPVDIATLENAKEVFGESNIFSTTIKNMERLKRYDLTGITDEDMHDKKVHNVCLVDSLTDEQQHTFKNQFEVLRKRIMEREK
ncbi:hypothetical protein ACA359_13045 [Enterococcus faecium]|uniref:hypothetical protein n=1 Tax=Enterococcus faecium TaxID=1352 RepID=UPI003B9E7164